MAEKDESGFIGTANGEGLSFEPEHLKGSGTIRPDGTYGPPEPDPTVVRGLGPHKTSGGRVIHGGGLGDVETEETSPVSSEDPKTRRQASSQRKANEDK